MLFETIQLVCDKNTMENVLISLNITEKKEFCPRFRINYISEKTNNAFKHINKLKNITGHIINDIGIFIINQHMLNHIRKFLDFNRI